MKKTIKIPTTMPYSDYSYTGTHRHILDDRDKIIIAISGLFGDVEFSVPYNDYFLNMYKNGELFVISDELEKLYKRFLGEE
jgi:hypothetical protein